MKTKEMTKRCQKDVKTTEKAVIAHATWANRQRDMNVTVYLKDALTSVQLDYPRPMKRHVKYADELDEAISQITASLIRKLQGKRKEDSKSRRKERLGGLTVIEATFYEVVKNQEELFSNWPSKNTRNGYFSYFERNILPLIKDCESPDDFGLQERAELKASIFRKRMENPLCEKNEEESKGAVGARLWQAQTIYDKMCEIDSDLPKLKMNDGSCVGTIYQKEQVKSLPYAVLRNLRKRIEELIPENPRFARAAALMESGALRSGEASAVTKSKIIDCGDFSIVWVLQQESDGMISNTTKTPDGYRMVLLDQWGTEVVRKCNELIGEEDEIYRAPLLDKELSGGVRRLLEECGCSKETMEAAEKVISESENTPMDVSAHVLRRNRASIWRNICGFVQWEIDYLLGHKNFQSVFEKGNPKDEKTIRRWAEMMKRYDTERRGGLEPGEIGLVLSDAKEERLMPFTRYRVINPGDDPLVFNFKVEAAEMDDGIAITFDEKWENLIQSETGIVKGKRKNINLIGGLNYG